MSTFITIALCCYVFHLYKGFHKLLAALEHEFDSLKSENVALRREVEEIRQKLYLMNSE